MGSKRHVPTWLCILSCCLPIICSLPLVLAMAEWIDPHSELAAFVNSSYSGWVLALIGPSAIVLAVMGLLRGRGKSICWAVKGLAWLGIALGLIAGVLGVGLIWLNYAFRDFQWMGD